MYRSAGNNPSASGISSPELQYIQGRTSLKKLLISDMAPSILYPPPENLRKKLTVEILIFDNFAT